MANLFMMCVILAYENVAFAFYEAWIQAELCMGSASEHTGEIPIPQAHYDDRRLVPKFLKYVANCLILDQLSLLRRVNYFTMLIDECTSRSIVSCAAIYICFQHPDTFESSVIFFGLFKLHGGSGKLLYRSVVSWLALLGIEPTRRLMFFISDGASAMRSVRTGLGKRLRDSFCEAMVMIHCVCHRLPLGSAECFAMFPECIAIDKILTKSYGFFKKSHAQRDNFREMTDEFDIKYKLPKRFHKVRWLSRGQSVERLIELLVPFVAYLRSVDENFVKTFENFSTLFILFAVADLLVVLNVLSSRMQSTKWPFSNLSVFLDEAFDSINEMFVTPALDLSDPEQRAKYGGKYIKLLLGTIAKSENGSYYDDIRLNFDKSEDECQHRVMEIAIMLIMCIKDRFPDIEILEALCVFDPARLPDSLETIEKDNYGKEAMHVIFEHYGDVIGVETLAELMEQWIKLRKIVFCTYRNVDIFTFVRRFHHAFTHQATGAPDPKYTYMLLLLELCNIIVMANAHTERGFAHLNDIWTHQRGRLAVRTINDVMVTKFLGPTLGGENEALRALCISAARHWGTQRGPQICREPVVMHQPLPEFAEDSEICEDLEDEMLVGSSSSDEDEDPLGLETVIVDGDEYASDDSE
ncbi:hypothetical protein CYMTET_16216 [Cymbomonas tetramitiformis]|uniref:Uncharacterized protein n=1 Tax=Cymbomonas tetramitiformis TaxID=36881 RepID=A0AAE0GCS6_9CHLO|nr:hypothetical protein CYMTET_16216 [Cymbomonas tetramitiformis]